MPYRVAVDTCSDQQIGDYLDFLEECGSPRIDRYTARGPGGGNPEITLTFENYDNALKFVVLTHDEGTAPNDWHRSLIHETIDDASILVDL